MSEYLLNLVQLTINTHQAGINMIPPFAIREYVMAWAETKAGK